MPVGHAPGAPLRPAVPVQIAFAPEEKRWKDFYGFNKNGNWISFAAMVFATFLICLGIMALQKL